MAIRFSHSPASTGKWYSCLRIYLCSLFWSEVEMKLILKLGSNIQGDFIIIHHHFLLILYTSPLKIRATSPDLDCGFGRGTLLEVYQGIQIWKVIIHIHPHISDLFFLYLIKQRHFPKKSCPTKKHKHIFSNAEVWGGRRRFWWDQGSAGSRGLDSGRWVGIPPAVGFVGICWDLGTPSGPLAGKKGEGRGFF